MAIYRQPGPCRAASEKVWSTLRSELYYEPGGNPALPVLCCIPKLSHKPIRLHQANADSLSKPYVQTATNPVLAGKVWSRCVQNFITSPAETRPCLFCVEFPN
jgi:hypothetical protein